MTRSRDFEGKVYLYGKNLDTGAVYQVNGDERVRTASTIKLPIMVAVFQAVADGQAKWSDELTLRERQGIGFRRADGVFGRRETPAARRHAPDDRSQ